MNMYSAFQILLLLTSISSSTASLSGGGIMSETHPKFADALTSNLYGEKEENECTSCLGISMAFSLIYPGSTGNSTIEIRDVLGYPITTDPMDHLIWKETSDRLENTYQGECAIANVASTDNCRLVKPSIQIANSIWVDDETSLLPEYQNLVSDYVNQMNLQDANAPRIINSWINETTNGLISSIFEEDKQLTYTLIAINSIYLKASWQHPFRDGFTNIDKFYTSRAREMEVGDAHFMHQKFTNIMYSHDALYGFQVVQVPLAASDMSMIFTLPLAGTTTDESSDLTTTTTSTEVLQILSQLVETNVAMALPKFKFETTYEDDLKKSLMSLGMTTPFEDGDLCNITGVCDLFIDTIIQKTVIDVNEKGVEAAAATVLALDRSAIRFPVPHVLFVADHPFQFYIYDKTENLILFEGQVGNPGLPSSSTDDESSTDQQPLLQSVHSENDFWFKNFNLENVTDPGDAFVPKTKAPVIEEIVSDTDGKIEEKPREISTETTTKPVETTEKTKQDDKEEEEEDQTATKLTDDTSSASSYQSYYPVFNTISIISTISVLFSIQYYL